MATLKLAGVLPISARVVETARGAVRSVQSSELSDLAKEQAARQASLNLMRAFVSIILRVALATATSILPLLIFHVAGLAPWSAVTQFLASWPGVGLASIAMGLTYFVRTK